MDLNALGGIAEHLDNPLFLVGVVLVLVFGVHRALLMGGIIPPVGPGQGAGIVRLLLRYGFWLAILVISAGFVLSATQSYV